MSRLRAIVLATAGLLTTPAWAGIVFTPHLSEYARLPAGQYTEFTLVTTEIEELYDRNGKKQQLGTPFVPAGDSTDAAIALFKSLWVGNVFRDSGVPFLDTHPQFCRLIGTLGYQQNTGAIARRARLFGAKPGGNGVGDLYGLCGVFGDEHQWGPLHINGLFGTTVKFPIGQYDQDGALNPGTHYWSYIPQLAWHADLWGRLIMDGTFAWQFNGDNDEPAFGGLTPTHIADWRNFELNLAWKFNEHWYADIGWGRRESVGSNRYDQVTVNFKDQPLAPETACASTNNGTAPVLGLLGIDPLITPEICNSPLLDQFYLKPQPGPYSDRGIKGTLMTAGIYYIYRTSTVLQARIAQPISGRGSQIDAVFDVCTTANCESDPRPVSSTTTTLYGVQEAAAISASPYLELRMVYLFWAP